jgi:site-specific recombinase XerD
MLECWYREKRTLVDFRRGPLGSYFDGFAAHLKAKGYSRSVARGFLGKCCLFNAFLIEQNVRQASELSAALAQSFIQTYNAPALALSSRYSPSGHTRRALRCLFEYLSSIRVYLPPKPKPVLKPYTWLLASYLGHLRKESSLAASTIHYREQQLVRFLGAFGEDAARRRFGSLKAEAVERRIAAHLRESTAHPRTVAPILRAFLRHCALHHFTKTDFAGLVPPIRTYRHASLPKGVEDRSLESMLKAIPKDTAEGARDYAMLLFMMAYGIRGVSVAELLLDDIDWPRSKIRIRARKGGKEVVLPLLEPVGDAIIGYLKHRRAGTPFREVFLHAKAPYDPLNSLNISSRVRHYLNKAGVHIPGGGSRTLRHSWAIRALAHNSAIKSIADVLGHRCIDTTFIYAKADLNSLREVALPWPEKR